MRILQPSKLSAARLLTTMTILLVIGGIVLIAINKQAPSSALVPTTPATSNVQNIPPQSYETRIDSPTANFELVVDEHKIVSGPTVMHVHKNDSVNVSIRVVAEEAALKLEGYDIITESSPIAGVEGAFKFIADHTGTFPFYSLGEEHEPGAAPEQHYLGSIIVAE